MTKAIKYLTILDILFIILLSCSGSFSGVLGRLFYYASFALPLFFGIYLARRLKREREEEAGCSEASTRLFKYPQGFVGRFLPLIAPTVAVVFLLAFVTSKLLGLIGIEDGGVPDTGLVNMLFEHALLPCVSEELVFRLIPMILLLPYGKRSYILISSLYFSLCHLNLVRMPYAFVAGLIFASLNCVFESMYPSLILHFLNNAASVVWIRIYGDSRSMLIFILALLVLSLVSSVFIFIGRNRYIEDIKGLLDRPAEHKAGREILLLAAFTLILAFTELFI